MAANGGDEKASFGKIVRKEKKYGSTTKSAYTNESYISHKVVPGETLQGIALKHGVTMENLKRANKMWTNDSLFLRDTLLIPIPINSITQSNSSDFHFANGEENAITDKNTQNGSNKESQEEGATAEPEESAKDFLSRFDSSLAQIKTSVQKFEETSSLADDETNPLSFLPHRKTKSSSRHRLSSIDDPSYTPEPVIKTGAKSKKVKNSLEKLEKRQDEMFEL